ncbi:MAG: 3D domain-containing protein [Firmicutes bacterium]|nr:3D domain-containing protein [Bacillota bacterium]
MIPLRTAFGAVALAFTVQMTDQPVDSATTEGHASVWSGIPAGKASAIHTARPSTPQASHRATRPPRRNDHKKAQQAPGVEAMAALAPVLSDAHDEGGPFALQHSYECMLTAYGPGFVSTGKRPGDPGYGITASGRVAQPRHTIAVDPDLIPLGSIVYIDGIGYRVAEDVGGAIKGHHIDVFFANDDQARIFGVKSHVKVYVFGHLRPAHELNQGAR